MLAWGEGEAMVMAPWAMHDSAVSPCFHGCLAFPTTVSSLTSPWSISQQSTAALTLGLLHIPKLQHPTTAPSKGPASLSRVRMAAARTVWFSFHSGCHKSTISFSALNVSPLIQTVGLDVGIRPLFQFPHPPRVGPVLVTLLFFPLVP